MSFLIAGIDLGTSNSVIGVFKDGKIQIVPNSIGDSLTPSIVQFLDKGEAIGEETIMHKADAKIIITEIKRLAGKDIADLDNLKKINKNICAKDGKIQLKIIRNGKEEFFTPEVIMSYIFKKLINSASDFIETSIKKAVITVPAYFDYKQRSSIEESARLAGIEVLRIINEPTAAALAYGLGTSENFSNSIASSIIKEDNKNKRKIIVFDLGGGTLDISILILENTNFEVVTSLGDTYLGGNDFDNKLVDYCLKDFSQKMNLNENDIKKDLNAIRRLKNQCEKAKKKLTINDSTSITVNNFYNNNNLFIEISRQQFNDECNELYERIEIILDKALSDSKFKKEEIDDVILIGGSSKIPKIKELLGIKFSPNKIRDKINQDEAVAIGATWQAYKLINNKNNIDILDITPFSLGVGVLSENEEERSQGILIMSILINKDSKIPIRAKTKTYKTFKDNQEFFHIRVYSGEEKYCKDNKLMKEFSIKNLPKGKAGSVNLTINFEIDVNGILFINAEVESIGKKVTEKYSIYNKDESVKKIKHNIKEKEKLEEIKDIICFINEKNDGFNNIINENDKIEYLKDLIESCTNLIIIYESLNNDKDSGILYEKIFDYTKMLFNYYLQMIKLDKENNRTSDIIKNIKERLPKFINDNIENLIEIFNELKKLKPKIYIDIILFTAKMLYEEGNKILEAGQKYARYYSKKFYQKAESIKKYIDNDLEKQMDFKLKKNFEEMEKNYGSKVAEIDSFVNAVKSLAEEKSTEFISNKTGYTAFHLKLKKALEDDQIKADDIYFILDILQEMADSLQKRSKDDLSETEAYCRANIIKINFLVLKNYNFEFYEKLNNRIEYIYERLEKDDDDDPKWYKQLIEINEQIKKKKEEEEEKGKKQLLIENKKYIDEINYIFDEKINEKKPIEFLYYLLENYPFINCDESKIENLKKNNFKELFNIIFPKYQPDNYSDLKNYPVYTEIYIKLVKIEELFFKNNK